MNGDEETIGLMEFIRLFTLPGEAQDSVTLEGKAWDEERGMAVPSGEMMTWTPRHPPQPFRQIVPGINPPPIEGGPPVGTAWNRKQERCVFVFRSPREVEPEFIVDERGVRSLLPDVAEMSSLLLPDEEKLVLMEEAQACHLTWPVSLKKVLAWAERMGYELAGQDETDSSDEKRKPGPIQSKAMKAAVAMALRLIDDGKLIKSAVLESADEHKVKPGSLDRTVRRRRNQP